MGWLSGIAIYVLIWWIVLFTVLPWGAHPPENPGLGHVASAPKAPNLKRKFLVTTALAALAWVIVYLLIRADIIDFREIALKMMQKDQGT